MNKIIAALVALPLLASCTTTSPEVKLANNNTACAAYGFTAGSDAYANCMMQLDMAGKAEDRQRQQAIGDAISEMGENMQQSRPVTCNTYGTARPGFGTVHGQSTTTCY